MIAAISSVMAGIIFISVLSSLPQSGYILFFYLLSGVCAIGIIDEISSWSIGYLIGWLFANGLMIQGGILSLSDIIICVVAGISVLLARQYLR